MGSDTILGPEEVVSEPPARPLPAPMPTHRVLNDPWLMEQTRRLLQRCREWEATENEALVLARGLGLLLRGRALSARIAQPKNLTEARASLKTPYHAADVMGSFVKDLSPEDQALAAVIVVERAVAQLRLNDEMKKLGTEEWTEKLP